jgi:DNA primase
VTHGDAKEQVRQATDIVELVGKYLDLRRQGRHFVGLCPWHNDRKPSLTVNPERQTWKCWVCDIGGDVFSFIMQKEGCDFREAIQMLADRAGIQLSPQRQKKVEPGSPDDKNTLFQAVAWAEKQFHEFLIRSEQAEGARHYVEDRGITPASVERFRVGCSPDNWTWLVDKARNTPFSPKVLEACGLIGQSERGGYYDRFKGRVIFPIRDGQSRPIAFGGRILPGNKDENAAKYVNSPETRLFSKSDNLYALDIARNHITKTRQITVVEGYTDVVLCHQYGVNDVVACLGTALGPRHLDVLRRFADTVFLVLDGDEAGIRRANEILGLFVTSRMDLRVAVLPEEFDPAEMVVERGPEPFRTAVVQAKDALNHKIDIETAGVDVAKDSHQAVRAAENVLSTIAGALVSTDFDPARFRAMTFAVTIARRLHLDVNVIQDRLVELVRGMRQRTSPLRPEESAAKFKLADLTLVEIELLEILDLQPTLAVDALAEIADGDLSSAAAREIFATYRKLEELGQSLDFGSILSEIENASLKNILVGIDETAQAKSGKSHLDGPSRLRSIIRLFQQKYESRELRETQAILEQGTTTDEEEKLIINQQLEMVRRRHGIIAPTEG